MSETCLPSQTPIVTFSIISGDYIHQLAPTESTNAAHFSIPWLIDASSSLLDIHGPFPNTPSVPIAPKIASRSFKHSGVLISLDRLEILGINCAQQPQLYCPYMTWKMAGHLSNMVRGDRKRDQVSLVLMLLHYPVSCGRCPHSRRQCLTDCRLDSAQIPHGGDTTTTSACARERKVYRQGVSSLSPLSCGPGRSSCCLEPDGSRGWAIETGQSSQRSVKRAIRVALHHGTSGVYPQERQTVLIIFVYTTFASSQSIALLLPHIFLND